jgi:hypothetical protein
VWQCVGVVGGALAVVSLDKNEAFNDYACGLVIFLCGWLAATTMDASNWFNRNLAIIRNLERLFLREVDNRLVHHFISLPHRHHGKFAEHFLIQLTLAIVVALFVLAYHFERRVRGGLSAPWSTFEFPRAIPYVAAFSVAAALLYLGAKYRAKDRRLKDASPGFDVLLP